MLVAIGMLLVLTTPVVAEHHTHACTVDVGAPLILVDVDRDGDEGPAIGGCLLVDDAEQRYRVGPTFPAHWVASSCTFQVDHDGDGSGFELVDRRDEIPEGANLWAKCEAGLDLENRITLHALD